MARRLRHMCLILALVCGATASTYSQELRAELRISTEQLGPVEPTRYRELERQLTDLLNGTRWTQEAYAPSERIACSFVLKLTSLSGDRSHRGELSVAASRPVYGTSYSTPTFVYRDREVAFDYALGQSLEYTPQALDNALVALIAYYAQCIVASDMDSFAPLAGSALHSPLAQLIGQAASRLDWEGWQGLSDLDGGRTRLATALGDGGHEAFRMLWYRYHRHGLDILESDIARGRTELLTQLKAYAAYRQQYPSSPYLELFETTKADELAQIFAEAPTEERLRALELCRGVFPTKGDVWQRLSRRQ